MYFVQHLGTLYNCDYILKIEYSERDFCRVTFVNGDVIALPSYEIKKFMTRRNENKDVQM